jgi:hypothetical protein
MPSKQTWLALGCGAYVAFALAQFPAATAYRWLAPPELVLAGISGTVWAGRAALAGVNGVPVRDLEWRLGALRLALAQVSADFSARLADGFVEGSMSAGLGQLRLTDVRVASSLDTLGAALPLQGARGLVSLELEELTLREGWPVSIVGTLRLRQLEVPPLLAGPSTAPIPLGDYELSNFAVSTERLAAQLRDHGGPLEVEGTVALALQTPGTMRGARPMFSGRVRDRADLPAALREPLDFVTTGVDAEGWRTLDLDPWLRQL